ncbi:MAG: hypothetical protein QOC82_656 [Frankiaceae bacterium]|jgi:hypothetical protein|nr:hypothetical protein [Frankiaceae bacterium]
MSTIRMLKLAAATSLTALLVTVPAPGAGASGTSPQPHLRLLNSGVSAAASLGSGNLVNYGGHVESGTVTNYVIYWGLPSQALPAPAYDVNPYAAHIDEFLHDVSCCASPALASVLTQYVGAVNITYGGSYFDPIGYTPNSTVTDAQIQAEVRKVQSATGWRGGIGNNFFVVTGPGEKVCDSSGCSNTEFCGYHGTLSDVAGAETPHEAIPYPGPGCLVTSIQGATDAVTNTAVNVVSHELFETITDPGVGAGDYGWYDGAGYEIADKCAYIWGLNIGLGQGDFTTGAGENYLVQEEYSNAASDCRMS